MWFWWNSWFLVMMWHHIILINLYLKFDAEIIKVNYFSVCSVVHMTKIPPIDVEFQDESIYGTFIEKYYFCRKLSPQNYFSKGTFFGGLHVFLCLFFLRTKANIFCFLEILKKMWAKQVSALMLLFCIISCLF